MLLVAACARNEYQAPPPPAVTVATPQVRDVVEYAEFTGTTAPFETVEVRARVEGILEQIRYTEGGRVAQNDPLFRIDPAPFLARRDAAASRVRSAAAEAALAQTTAERMERAREDDAVSELQALEARARAEAAAAAVDVAEKDLAIRELELSYTEVCAPIAGIAARSSYQVGSLVGTLSSAWLTTIIDDHDVYVWFSIPDRVLLRFPAEDRRFPEVEVATELDEGWPHRGRVDYTDPEVDAKTGTLRIRARIANPDRRLIGGLFVRCRLQVKTWQQALLVPEAAIGSDQSGQFVLVVDDRDIVVRRAVRLGPRDGQDRVILDQLTKTDRVIVDGLLRARPGAKVLATTSTDT